MRSTSAASAPADIIAACETGEPFRFNGNVPNGSDGGLLIDNLPADCCVEVPCVAGTGGIAPEPVGGAAPPPGRAHADECQRCRG
jgi:alpha-galactosidase/6-phospho-beta-glucosidase family protein